MKTIEGRRPIIKNKKYSPATGIQADFEKLLTSFVETKSVRYEEFAKVWRERKFSLLWAGRQTDREAVEFMEECMKLSFKMFLPPYGFQARVGALYLLYGLYYTQPCIPKVKVRVVHSEWVQIKAMQEEFLRQNHHDTNFILQKLLIDGAFLLCAVSEMPRRNYTQADEPTKTMSDALREDRQRVDDLFSNEALEQLQLVHKQYHQLKVRVAGPDASRPDRSLDVLQENFPNSITNELRKHHERWNKKESARQGRRSKPLPTIPEYGESEDQDAESDPDYRPKGNVGQRRTQLKAMAFRGAKNKQRYKHRTLLTEAFSSPDSTKSPKKRGRRRGDCAETSIQRALTSEMEVETVTDSADPVLHMPQVAEDAEPEGKKAGRKRKAQADNQSSNKPPKQKKLQESSQTQNSATDAVGETAVEETTEATAESTQSPQSPRKRGRPPKPKTGTPPKARKVGRPRKQAQAEDGEGNFKMPTWRVIPLKIKDSGKRKKKE